MMENEKYKGRYRIPSARAWWHRYNGGIYYVTICTKDRENYFGRIVNDIMELSEIGNCLNEQIMMTPKMRADMNLEIPLYVIMPNHVHLIVIIGDNMFNVHEEQENGKPENDGNITDGDAKHCVSTMVENSFAPQSKNLASVIRGIKIATTSYATNNHIEFGWQPRFHDHIVRNDYELNRISKYIENNVSKWVEDEFYKKQ